MSTSNVKLCKKLKADAEAVEGDSQINGLRLRILDYFIDNEVSDDIFPKVLKTRINDPDPAKEESKIICAQILEAWENNHRG